MTTSRAIRSLFVLALLVAVTSQLVACGGYQLRGTVVRGDYSAIEFVQADDPRLDGPGIGGVSLHLQSDPNKLNRETIARTTSAPDGAFAIPVDLPGAGFLIYDVGLYARKESYSPAQNLFRLPGKGKRVLIGGDIICFFPTRKMMWQKSITSCCKELTSSLTKSSWLRSRVSYCLKYTNSIKLSEGIKINKKLQIMDVIQE